MEATVPEEPLRLEHIEHAGGERGWSVLHASETAFYDPGLVVDRMVRAGEAGTCR